MFKARIVAPLLTTCMSLILVSVSGCGDVSRLKMNLTFPDADVASVTQQLLVVVRDLQEDGEPCDALWGEAPSGVAEFAQLVGYPNRTDVVAAPLDVGSYTVLVYAYDRSFGRLCTEDAECGESEPAETCRNIGAEKSACMSDEAGLSPIAGGCIAEGVISAKGATDIDMALEKRP